MKTLLLTGIIIAASVRVLAGEVLWSGVARNAQWNDAANWSGGMEPTSGDAVTFNSSKGLTDWGGIFVSGQAESGPLTIDLPFWAVRSTGGIANLDLYGNVTFTARFNNNEGKGVTFRNRTGGRLRLRLGTHVLISNAGSHPVVFDSDGDSGFGIASVGASRDLAFTGSGDFNWLGGVVFPGVGNVGTAPGFSGTFNIHGGKITPSGQFRIHDGRVNFLEDSLLGDRVTLVFADSGGRDATADFSGRENVLGGLRIENNGGRLIVDGRTSLEFGGLEVKSGSLEISGFIDGVTRIVFRPESRVQDGVEIPGLLVNGQPAKWKALGEGWFAVAAGAPLAATAPVPAPAPRATDAPGIPFFGGQRPAPAAEPATTSPTAPVAPAPAPVVARAAPVEPGPVKSLPPIRSLPSAPEPVPAEVPSVDRSLVLIPEGPVNIGNHFPDGPPDQVPVHAVTLSAFLIGAKEVTNAEVAELFNWANANGFLVVDSEGVRNARGDRNDLLNLDARYVQIRWDGSFSATPGKEDYPCVEVTWFGAAAYANFKSEREGLRPCYDFSNWECDFKANGYRLPTEAEWEKAARGGLIGKRFPWGDTISHAQANYYSLSSVNYDVSPTRGYHPKWDVGENPYTSPAGSFEPNGYGLYDMAGNVWEWCNDWYGDGYYRGSPDRDPTGPSSGESRILRGGAWGFNPPYNAVAFRNYSNPLFSSYYFGFRIARNAE